MPIAGTQRRLHHGPFHQSYLVDWLQRLTGTFDLVTEEGRPVERARRPPGLLIDRRAIPTANLAGYAAMGGEGLIYAPHPREWCTGQGTNFYADD